MISLEGSSRGGASRKTATAREQGQSVTGKSTKHVVNQ